MQSLIRTKVGGENVHNKRQELVPQCSSTLLVNGEENIIITMYKQEFRLVQAQTQYFIWTTGIP